MKMDIGISETDRAEVTAVIRTARSIMSRGFDDLSNPRNALIAKGEGKLIHLVAMSPRSYGKSPFFGSVTAKI